MLCVCVHVLRLLATYCAAFVYMETAMSECENSKLPEVSVAVWTDNRHQPQLTCVLFVSSPPLQDFRQKYTMSKVLGRLVHHVTTHCSFVYGNVNGYTCISLYVMCFVCLSCCTEAPVGK